MRRRLGRPASAFQNDRRQADLSARLVLSQTIFSSGAVTSRMREARARSEQARFESDMARRNVIEGVGQAWSQTHALRTVVAHNTDRVAALRSALDGAREEERQGERTTLEVLNQAQELQTAQLELIRSQTDRFLSQVNLLANMGVLEPGVLSPGLEAYDPQKAFDRVKKRGDMPWTPVLLMLDRATQADHLIRPSSDPAFGGGPGLDAAARGNQ